MSNPQKVTTVRTEAVGDGLGIYDYQRDESYVLNATSALVWQHCDGKTTPQQLTTLIQQKFNVVRLQAEHLLSSALNELEQAKLLRRGTTPQPTLSRRHVLQGFAAAGLSLALLPVVAPVTVYAGEGSVFPTLTCVVNNGDGTYTARFGYRNESSSTVSIPVGTSKNMFAPGPKDRGQPTDFLPGTHDNVFEVVFDGSKIKWLIKEDQAKRQQVEASSDSPSCPPPTTTTTTAPPTTTTTGAPPTTTTTGAPPP